MVRQGSAPARLEGRQRQIMKGILLMHGPWLWCYRKPFRALSTCSRAVRFWAVQVAPASAGHGVARKGDGEEASYLGQLFYRLIPYGGLHLVIAQNGHL